MKSALRALARIIAATCVLTVTAHAASQDTERLQQAWRTAISHKAVPGEGCFTASYPLLVWQQVRCVTAPKSAISQLRGTGAGNNTVTGGDYAAVTKPLTSAATGSFPVAKHLKSETSYLGANDYSLQLNSNYMENDKACAGEGVAGACRGWEQFVFDNLYGGYIQTWLVFYNATCPAGWNAGVYNSCWINSPVVAVPPQVITELPHMSLAGSAVAGGLDTLVLTTSTQAYSTTVKDSRVYLARGWHATDFNVLGDGSTPATFNPGASLTDRVDLTDKSKKPTCQAYGGHSAETNNLVEGPCKAIGGSVPAMQFVETAPN